MPKRKQPRDFYTDWELWEMDGKLHVQLTVAGIMRAIERGKAERLVAQVIERAKATARVIAATGRCADGQAQARPA